MAKRKADLKLQDAKVVVYCRIDPATIEGLDRIAKSMQPQPNRAALIDLACAKFVQQHSATASTDLKKGD